MMKCLLHLNRNKKSTFDKLLHITSNILSKMKVGVRFIGNKDGRECKSNRSVRKEFPFSKNKNNNSIVNNNSFPNSDERYNKHLPPPLFLYQKNIIYSLIND